MLDKGLLEEVNLLSKGFLSKLSGIDNRGSIEIDGREFRWAGFIASQDSDALVGYWTTSGRDGRHLFVSSTGKLAVEKVEWGASWRLVQDDSESYCTWDDLTCRPERLMEAKAAAFRRLREHVAEVDNVRG